MTIGLSKGPRVRARSTRPTTVAVSSIRSEPIVLTIAPLRRGEIITDDGTLTLRFLYSAAPNHVANFLELAESGFYNGTVFHRLESGYYLQGGCPRGDGTGIRADGKRLKAEFSHFPMRKGVPKFLKRYHLQHHYKTPEQRFGVSSPLWDLVLGTKPMDS